MKLVARFPYIITAIAALSLLATTVVVVYVVSVGRTEDQHDCERAVQGRDDNRTMWVYLIDKASPGKKGVAEFTKELNKRLPPLECVNQNPVPVNSE